MRSISKVLPVFMVLSLIAPSFARAESGASLETLVAGKQAAIDSRLEALATAKEKLRLLQAELAKTTEDAKPTAIAFLSVGLVTAVTSANLVTGWVFKWKAPRFKRANKMILLAAGISQLAILAYGGAKYTVKMRKLDGQIADLRTLIDEYETQLRKDRAELDDLVLDHH